MGGGEIFGDDEISVSKFRCLPQIFWGAIWLPIKSPPQMATARKDAAGMAAADQCRHLLMCLTESRKYPANEDVRVGSDTKSRKYPAHQDVRLRLSSAISLNGPRAQFLPQFFTKNKKSRSACSRKNDRSKSSSDCKTKSCLDTAHGSFQMSSSKESFDYLSVFRFAIRSTISSLIFSGTGCT